MFQCKSQLQLTIVLGNHFRTRNPILLSSLFLSSPYEDDDTAFRKLVFGTLAGSLGICVITLVILFYTGTIPKFGLTD